MVGRVKTARSSVLVAVATAAATSLGTSVVTTLIPIDDHSLTSAVATLWSRLLGPTAMRRTNGVPAAVVQPVVVRTNPLWSKTSRAHSRQSLRPFFAVLGAIVVVVVWDDGPVPVGPG